MGLAELLTFKKPETKADVPEEKEEQKEEEPPKQSNANVVYPFSDVKATSFPPPLSIDASVYTDPANLNASNFEKQEVIETPDKNGKPVTQTDEKVKEEKIEDDKKRYAFENEVCDSKTCLKEKRNLETCVKDRNNGIERDTSFNEQRYLAEKIGQEKLTEMINSSIKEAMETIVKQCRMNKENDQDKKLKDDFNKCVCRPKDKYPCRSRQRSKKHKADRSKRLHEVKVKNCEQKGNVIEEARSKKRSKVGKNIQTDNRRMTGNVNIYICSEATENAQPAKSKKPEQPCTESSSETATDRSNISSSKLVTCIRNKRRKFKEQNCLDLLAQKNESSENSNTSSLVSQSTDSNITTELQSSDSIVICQDIGKDICERDTELSLTECECKDSSNSDATIDRSDQSFKRSKFVICDKVEKPCSTIYPAKAAKSDSDEWSSKSICSSRNDDYGNYRLSSSKEDYKAKRKFMKACRCHKQNRDSSGDRRCKCGDKRRRLTEKENFMQPLSTCTCIAEEEEEELCVDAEECQKSTQEPISICTNVFDSLDKSATMKSAEELVKEKTEPEGEKEIKPEGEKEIKPEGEKEVEPEEKIKQTVQGQPLSQYAPQRLVRPEVLVLRNILKQQNTSAGKLTSEIGDQTKTINPNLNQVKKNNSLEEPLNNPTGDETKPEPAFMKKFNLREKHKFIRQLDSVEEQPPAQETEDKSSGDKVKEENKGAKNIQGKMKGSFLYKNFKKVLEKKENPQKKSGKSKEKDKIGEDTKDNSADEKPEIPKTEVKKDQAKSGSKDTKKKDKFMPKLNVYKMLRMKKNKPESNAARSKKTAKKGDKNDSESKPVEEIKAEEEKTDLKEETPVDVTENQEKSKVLTAAVDQKPSPPSLKDIKDAHIEKLEQTKPQKLRKASEEIAKKIEPPEPLKAPEIQKIYDDQEKKIPEIQKPAIEAWSMRNHIQPEAPTAQYARKRSLSNESKQFIQRCQTHSSELRTVCMSPKCINCTDINENFSMNSERFDESRCNCCCLPTSQCTNEFMNHPKSCLKKDRQFRCTNSQEINTPMICHDKRNWGECGCRILYCEGCRRPRTECSCRFTCVSCTSCCKPRNKCSCKSICKGRRSTFCVYCDNPRENCRCRAPLKKCSCCEMPMDLCRCKDQRAIREGRPILAEQDKDRTMYVTAWKPREEIRRYFSRNLDVPRTDSTNECWCCEKLIHRNSDDLPYQRLSVFSDVMDELQQKISESTCCTRCRTTPCCCNVERERGTDERKIKCCISPKTRRKLVAVCMEKPKVKSLNNYKCDSGKERGDKQRKIIVCCLCKSTPCRCKRSKPIQKKPRAKCYYCKSSPCNCIATGDCNKPRPCRCTDSPCRSKEKDNTPRGKISTKPRNNDEKIICVR